MKKTKDAGPVLQKNRKLAIFCAFFCVVSPLGFAEEQPVSIKAVDPIENSPKEKMRVAIFGTEAATPGCALVKTIDKEAVAKLDKDLDKFLKDLLAAVKSRDEMSLQPLFHKRTNTSLAAIGESHARMASVVGLPLDVSIYKLWALNTVDGTPKGLNCDDEGVTAFPLYGYPLQFGLWLQVMGKTEVGRIFLSIVPAEGRWNIGSYHFHQWTHAEKDAGTWVKDAFSARDAGDLTGSYMRFDLAKKLLNAGKFLEIPAALDAEKAREAIMSSDKFIETVRMGMTKEDVPFIATLLVVDGVGLLYRMRVAEEISTVDIKKRCREHATKVKNQTWAKGITGLRCSFLMPREAPEKEGALGGIYIAFNELK